MLLEGTNEIKQIWFCKKHFRAAENLAVLLLHAILSDLRKTINGTSQTKCILLGRRRKEMCVWVLQKVKNRKVKRNKQDWEVKAGIYHLPVEIQFLNWKMENILKILIKILLQVTVWFWVTTDYYENESKYYFHF